MDYSSTSVYYVTSSTIACTLISSKFISGDYCWTGTSWFGDIIWISGSVLSWFVGNFFSSLKGLGSYLSDYFAGGASASTYNLSGAVLNLTLVCPLFSSWRNFIILYWWSIYLLFSLKFRRLICDAVKFNLELIFLSSFAWIGLTFGCLRSWRW